MNVDYDARNRAQFENRLRVINSAVRVYWKCVRLDSDTQIRFGIELRSEQDCGTIDSTEFSNFVDTVIKHVLKSELSDRLMMSDHFYNGIACYYSDRDITVEFTDNLNQVLLTTYYFNNLPSKEN